MKVRLLIKESRRSEDVVLAFLLIPHITRNLKLAACPPHQVNGFNNPSATALGHYVRNRHLLVRALNELGYRRVEYWLPKAPRDASPSPAGVRRQDLHHWGPTWANQLRAIIGREHRFVFRMNWQPMYVELSQFRLVNEDGSLITGSKTRSGQSYSQPLQPRKPRKSRKR